MFLSLWNRSASRSSQIRTWRNAFFMSAARIMVRNLPRTRTSHNLFWRASLFSAGWTIVHDTHFGALDVFSDHCTIGHIILKTDSFRWCPFNYARVVFFEFTSAFQSFNDRLKAVKTSYTVVRKGGIITFPRQTRFVPTAVRITGKLFSKFLVHNVLITRRRVR
jgi:hypothetical protein